MFVVFLTLIKFMEGNMARNYKVHEYLFQQLRGNIVVPQFQRSLVWDPERKANFIKTVIKGDPFGVLLVYDDPRTGHKQIIDGLQRFTTLIDFEKNPFKYYEIDFEDHVELANIVRFLCDEYPNFDAESVQDRVMEMIKEVFNEKSMQDLDRSGIFEDTLHYKIRNLYSEIKVSQTDTLIYAELVRFWAHLKSHISISDVNIPVVIYHGAPEELPLIFERLNTGGTSLTKYEVFASTWSSIIIQNIDQNIAKLIDRRYTEVMEKTELSIDNYNDGDILLYRKATLYEYCFALGKLIKEKASTLFGNSRSRDFDSVDSIGFSTLTTFLGLHLKDMVHLDRYVKEPSQQHNLMILTDVIVGIYKQLESILEPYIGIHTKYVEAQIISMAVTLFRMQYDLDPRTLRLETRRDGYNLLKLFEKHAPFRLLYDILRRFWAGSGDNKLNDIMKAPLSDNRYILPISDESWRNLLGEWMRDMFNKPGKSASSESRLFLSFITAPYIDRSEHKKYQIAWIVPKNMLKSKLVGEAVSHVGNLYLMHHDFKAYKTHIIGLDPSLRVKMPGKIFHYPDDEAFGFLSKPNVPFGYREFLTNRIDDLIGILTAIKPA
jgi:hypothetical protein